MASKLHRGKLDQAPGSWSLGKDHRPLISSASILSSRLVSLKYRCDQALCKRLPRLPRHSLTRVYTTYFQKRSTNSPDFACGAGTILQKAGQPSPQGRELQYIAIHLMKLVLNLVKPCALLSFWKCARRAADFLSLEAITRESQHPFLFANFIECQFMSLHFLYLEEC